MDNCGDYSDYNNDCSGLNNNFSELNNDFNNLNENINDLNNTLGLNGCVNNAYDAGEINGLQGLGCISRQYQSLVLLLILLYFWTTQFTTNYFMNANTQLTNNVSCLLDKLVDCCVENSQRCCDVLDAQNNKNNHKHKCKRRKHCDCCCDDCDD